MSGKITLQIELPDEVSDLRRAASGGACARPFGTVPAGR